MLRREIPLIVICEKSNFQTVVFAIMFVTVNGHTYKLFKNVFNDLMQIKTTCNMLVIGIKMWLRLCHLAILSSEKMRERRCL